ncbi:MAG: efflux RND transporter periplasmic adaptor subunit [Terracidiphilus sp.]
MRDKSLKAHVWLPLAVLCCAGCSKEQPYQKPITPVRVQAVATESPEDGPKYSGSIEPVSLVNVAFRLGGYVSEIMTVPDGGSTRPVHESDVVPKGAALVRLRDDDYKVKVAEAQSQLNQAQVGVDKAKLDYDRADELFKKQSLTKSDMDGAKAQLDNAQALRDGAKAMVAEANLALKDSVLTSPSDGVVIKRLVEVGSLVGPGTPAFVLADLSSLKAVFGAPDVLLAKLKVGMPLALTTEALPGKFTGRVTSIASAADPRSRVFDVEVTFANPGLRLKPGMIVTIQLANTHPAAGIPVIPMGSIVRSKSNPDGYAVYVVDEEGGKSVSRLRDVTLGNAMNNAVIVTAGLHPGEKVITSGATLVSDGETVQLVP